jgi:hypothetical protein
MDLYQEHKEQYIF